MHVPDHAAIKGVVGHRYCIDEVKHIGGSCVDSYRDDDAVA